jgi:predicted DNA-binding antitoxin AbrB/MazE fold protein
MKPFRAIYRDGLFELLDPVELPHGCHVRLENWIVVGQDEEGGPKYRATAVILGVNPQEDDVSRDA